MSGRWSGALSRRERARHAPAVAAGMAVCCRCGRTIRPGTPWQADHWPVPLEFGGTTTQPAHARCNTSAGGKRGAQITNARRRARATHNNRTRNIRGV